MDSLKLLTNRRTFISIGFATISIILINFPSWFLYSWTLNSFIKIYCITNKTYEIFQSEFNDNYEEWVNDYYYNLTRNLINHAIPLVILVYCNIGLCREIRIINRNRAEIRSSNSA